jgi:hypothetical protein
MQAVMEVHEETLITGTARRKLPEFIYNFSKSIKFLYIETPFHFVLTFHFKIIAMKNTKDFV